MAHPKMYEDEDRHLAMLRELCLAFPEARERVSHGRPNFYARVTFAYYGGSVKNPEPGGPMTPYDHAVLFRPSVEDRPALEQDPRTFVPAYLGSHGWLGLDLDAAPVDRQEVAELVDASYREVSGPRLVRLLDEAGSPADR
ncbi:phosphoribosylglycinamide formyltransferase [Paraoerskovia sediminicola]|uniref:Phosphoribosylglycinamide formyltransferase n=1 Tax=Paraoerskovia sediminicola TaxID=1138587 RepID=A0ABN6X9Y5_9CELL|nr:MmcQ/YjbR family DNA-binding protein [Paraoerskovia sediminicola]BDZ41707.1 phosphoribosylglycinamide formyltransferase [Paraoerskovia sediminicola]